MQHSPTRNILVGALVALAVLFASLNLIACVVGVWIASEIGGALSQEVVSGPKVGVLRIEGVILSGRPLSPRQEGIVYSEQMSDILKEAKTNDDIKAIVLRVDSPGGSVLALTKSTKRCWSLTNPLSSQWAKWLRRADITSHALLTALWSTRVL